MAKIQIPKGTFSAAVISRRDQAKAEAIIRRFVFHAHMVDNPEPSRVSVYLSNAQSGYCQDLRTVLRDNGIEVI